MAAGAATAAAHRPGQAADRARAGADLSASEPAADSQLGSAPADDNGQAIGDAVDHPSGDHDGAQLTLADLRIPVGYLHDPAELAAADGERARDVLMPVLSSISSTG